MNARVAIGSAPWRRGLRRAIGGVVLMLGGWAGHGSVGQTLPGAPGAGSGIDNEAAASYVDAPSGQAAVLKSNLVRAVVQARVAAAISPAPEVRLAPGMQAVWSHQLTNTGNAPTRFWLLADNAPGSDFDLAQVRIVQDLNGNGWPDAGEPTFTDVLLAPGQSVEVAVVAQAPADAQGGRFGRLLLRAVIAGGLSVAQITSQALTTQGAVFNLVQTASSDALSSGQAVTFSIQVSNSGGDAVGVPLSIDGTAAERIVVTVPMPQGVRFTDADAPPNAQLLYRLRGAAANAFVSSPPADLAQVEAVAFAFTSFPSGRASPVAVDAVITAGSGQVSSTATADYRDGLTSAARSDASNQVTVRVVSGVATLNYYTSQAYSRLARSVDMNEALFLQADAMACNHDPALADTLSIRIGSQASGDTEALAATETGPNTGLFRISVPPWTVDWHDSPIIPGNGRIETQPDDRLTATIEGCSTAVTPVVILVDPYGVVFDSRGNAPVAGVKVELIDVTGGGNGGQAGALARVFRDDGVTPAPASVVTGADGAYRFPLVAPSSYRLRATPPAAFGFPSSLAPGQLPAGRVIDPAGSYGGTFTITAESAPVQLDLPVDAGLATGLLVQKTTPRSVVEIGDFIDYQVQVRNVSGVALTDVTLTDRLPRGFAYLPGSARLGSEAVADPVGGKGPALRFAPFALADGTTARLRYRVRVEATAGTGEAVNHAQAVSTQPSAQSSNVAQAKVRVEAGVFSMKGFVVGRVFADCNANGLRDAGEEGVPGVRIWLQDGTYAITDGQGQYSFAGLRPTTHVAKLDPVTLPKGTRSAPLDARNAGDGDSRFIDMKGGDLMRADFALGPCSPALARVVAERRAALDDGQRAALGQPGVQGLSSELSFEAAVPVDPRSMPANGVLPRAGLPTADGGGVGALSLPLRPSPLPAGAGAGAGSRWSSQAGGVPSAADEAVPSRTLPAPLATTLPPMPGGVDEATLGRSLPAQAVPRTDAPFGFLSPRDGDALLARQTRVRIAVPLGSEATLRVNEQTIAESQVGERSGHPDRQRSEREYVGVNLRPGENTLSLTLRDAFGNVRAVHTLRLRAPGELAQLALTAEPPQARPDGQLVVPITVRVLDARGLPIGERTAVTLNARHGLWLIDDLNPSEAGVQVFIEGGQASFGLRAPPQPVTDRVTAASGRVKAQLDVPFAAPLRELVAVGVIEGVLNLRQGILQPARARDGFERELGEMAGTPRGGRSAGRAALFLKGKVRGDALLTLGYDSDKDTRERLFRDIQPDQFYPVYGDASVKGYDAQSSSRLYVRIDQNRSWLLHGDFTTPPASTARKLSAYARSMTGLRHHHETEDLTLDTFASRDTARQVVEELPGNGTSGPYLLSSRDLLVNSERVELLVRDRNQRAVVLSATAQTRFSDYEIEPFTGRILFRTPVPSVDADLNPVSIRITYEVDQGGRAFWVMGGELQAKFGEHISWGLSHVDDRNPQDPYQLSGVNAQWQDGPLTLVAELARSDQLSLGSGGAGRVEARYQGKDLQWQVYAGRTDEAFENPSSLLSRGREEAAAKLSYTLNDKTRLIAEALHTGDERTGERREGAQVAIERDLGGGLKLEMGLRHVQEHAGNDPLVTGSIASHEEDRQAEVTSVRAKLSTPVPGLPKATVFGEVEQALGDESRRMAAIGGDYRLSEQGRVYGRYEFISSLGGPYDLNTNERRNTAVLGIDGAYMENGRAFSEYRVRDAFEGRETEASIGLRNRWQLDEGLRLHTSFERVQALSGSRGSQGSSALDRRDEATAVTGALEYTADPDLKATGRLEYRLAPGSRNLLGTAGLAMRLDDEWTAMVREIINLVYSRVPGEGNRWQQRAQLGVAWRDPGDIWTALARYEWKAERDSTPLTGFSRTAHIASTHVNMKAARDLVLSGRYAIKWGRDRSEGLSSRGISQLVSGRALYDLAERWDVGLQGSRLFTSGGSSLAGLGGEVGYRVQTNLWLSMGHNVLGFREVDLSDEQATEQGTYLRLRFKFDEKLFGGL